MKTNLIKCDGTGCTVSIEQADHMKYDLTFKLDYPTKKVDYPSLHACSDECLHKLISKILGNANTGDQLTITKYNGNTKEI